MDQRVIIEMGMGNDLHGMDYQKAACRAIEDAFRHSTLPIFASIEMPTDTMRVQVTVGVQEPDKLDTDALVAMLPRGRATVTAVPIPPPLALSSPSALAPPPLELAFPRRVPSSSSSLAARAASSTASAHASL